MDLDLDRIRQLIDMVRKMKPPPDIRLDARAHVVCACGKRALATDLRPVSTPLIPTAQTNVCLHCPDKRIANRSAEKAKFFCVGCGDMVMETPPHTHKKTGVEFLAGGNYHICGCGNCSPAVRMGLTRDRHPDAPESELDKMSLKEPSRILEVALKEDRESAIRELMLITQLKNQPAHV